MKEVTSLLSQSYEHVMWWVCDGIATAEESVHMSTVVSDAFAAHHIPPTV